MNRLLIILFGFLMFPNVLLAKEGAILLHGLCRTPSSMTKMAETLEDSGYVVENVGYPSRTDQINTLADNAIGKALKKPKIMACSKVHFVTHSLGGILVRSYFQKRKDPRLGRVVMLAPPNQGSEVVDQIGSWRLVRWLNGPAGNELGTGENATPYKLGKINFECGVLTGDRSINWINSMIIPGKDDGKVSTKRSTSLGVTDYRVLHVTHPFIMKNKKVIAETIHFLRNGTFSESS